MAKRATLKLTVKDRTNALWVHPLSVKERAERIERKLAIAKAAIENEDANHGGSTVIEAGVAELLSECIEDAWAISLLDASVVDRLAPTPDELNEIERHQQEH